MADIQRAGIQLTMVGDKEYIASLQNLNRETRKLELQTKLAVAQLGSAPSATQKYNATMRVLTNEMQQAGKAHTVLSKKEEFLKDNIVNTQKEIEKKTKALEASQLAVQKTSEYDLQLQRDIKNLSNARLDASGEERKEIQKQINDKKQLQRENKVYTNKYKENIKEQKSAIKQLTQAEADYSKQREIVQFDIIESQIKHAEMYKQAQEAQTAYIKGGGRLTEVSSGFTSFGEKMEVTGRQVSNVGDTLSVGSLAVLGGATAVVLAASQWETAFAGVKKTNDELIGKNGEVVYSYDQLEVGLRNLAKEIPVSSAELAQMAETAGRLQVPIQNVEGFVETVAKVSASSNLSAEEASEAFGRLINITGSGIHTVKNLANSLIELGNNTATNEKDIMSMAKRWASTGAMIEMTDDQILGVSATLLSMGVSAEAGGSALQRSLQKIHSGVLSGGDDLQGFANVAGQSAQDFANAWKEDPSQAFITFLKGLDRIKESGGNLNKVLKDLKIGSVNEVNALMVLSSGYEDLAKNLGMSADAYAETNEEAMALNIEAEKAFNTTANNLIIAFNKLKDVAITAGKPLSEALIDFVDSLEPAIEYVGELAQAFADMDSESQRELIDTIVKLALIGPSLSVIGRLQQGVASLSKIMGTATASAGGFFAKLELLGKGELLNASSGIKGATKGFANLVPIIGGATTAIGGLLAVSALLAVGGYGAWKLWGEGAWRASEQAKSFGVTLSEESTQAVVNTQEMAIGFKNAVTLMEMGAEDGAVGVQEAFSNLASGSVREVERLKEDSMKVFNTLPQEIQEKLNEGFNETVKANDESIEKIEGLSEKANAIFAKSIEENRKLTENELHVIQGYYDQIAEIRLNANAQSEQDGINSNIVYQKDLEGMTPDVLAKREKMLNDEIQNAKKVYEEQKQAIKDIYASNPTKIGKQAYEESLAILEKEHKETTLQLGANILEVLRASGLDREAHDTLKSLGLEYKEVNDYLQKASEKYNETMIQGIQTMTGDAQKASEQWNEMLTNLNINELSEKSQKTLKEFAKTEEGWNELKFISKNAKLNTNQREFLNDVMSSNRYWYSLTWEERKVLLRDNTGEVVSDWLIAKGIWEGLELKHQEAILKSNTPETIQQALIDAGIWETLEFKEKIMLTQTNAGLAIEEALRANKQWHNLTPEVQLFLAQSNIDERVVELAEFSNLWKNEKFLAKLAEIDINAPEAETQLASLMDEWTKAELVEKNGEITFKTTGVDQTIHEAKQTKLFIDEIPEEKKTSILAPGIKARIEEVTDFVYATGGLKDDSFATTITTTAPVATKQLNEYKKINDQLNDKNVQLATRTNAEETAGKAAPFLAQMREARSKTVDFITRNIHETVYRTRYNARGGEQSFATGTNFHTGGMALVNDQRGSLFRELITLPDGQSFIPHGRNVLLDLPRGSKVLKADLTRQKFPRLKQYEKGVGYSQNELNSVRSSSPNINVTIEVGTRNVAKILVDDIMYEQDLKIKRQNNRKGGR